MRLSRKAGLIGKSDSERKVVSLRAGLGRSGRFSVSDVVGGKGFREMPKAGLIGRIEWRRKKVECDGPDEWTSMLAFFSPVWCGSSILQDPKEACKIGRAHV